MRRNDIGNILSKLVRDPETGCWIWTGATHHGYGRGSFIGKNVFIHRLVYEHLITPIPTDLQLDHLCKVRQCANPDHLEPVTSAENVHRCWPAPRMMQCEGCGQYREVPFWRIRARGWRFCSTACRVLIPQSGETRAKRSASLKIAYAEGRGPGQVRSR